MTLRESTTNTTLDILIGNRGGTQLGGWTTIDTNGGTSGSTGLYIYDGLWVNTGINNVFNSTGLGINTTSPSDALTVNGNIRIGPTTDSNVDYSIKSAGQLTISANDASTQDSSYTFLTLTSGVSSNQSAMNMVGSSTNKYIAFNTSNTERMRIDSNGYVGIGTNSPNVALDVRSGAGYFGNFTGSITTGFQTFATGGKLAVSSGANGLPATTGTTPNAVAFRIRGGDNATLDFGANSINTWLQATDFASGYNLNYHIHLNPNGGNVAIGNGGSTPSYKLEVNGAIYASGEISAFSDKRLKTDITTIPNALDKVKQLRGVYYTHTQTQKRGLGVIAQEIQEILPEVIANEGEYLGVAYGNIVGVLIEAVKELESENTQLKTQIQTILQHLNL